jgi:hypothetical protein
MIEALERPRSFSWHQAGTNAHKSPGNRENFGAV